MTSRPKFVRLRVAFGGRKSSFAFCMMSFLPLDLLDGRRDGAEGVIVAASLSRPETAGTLQRPQLARSSFAGRPAVIFGSRRRRDGSHARPNLERARAFASSSSLPAGARRCLLCLLPLPPAPSPPSPQSRSGRRGKRYFALLSEDC